MLVYTLYSALSYQQIYAMGSVIRPCNHMQCLIQKIKIDLPVSFWIVYTCPSWNGNSNSYDNENHTFAQDEVAEWLRRWTANPLGSARVGSNPILVDDFERPIYTLHDVLIWDEIWSPVMNSNITNNGSNKFCCTSTYIKCHSDFYDLTHVHRFDPDTFADFNQESFSVWQLRRSALIP